MSASGEFASGRGPQGVALPADVGFLAATGFPPDRLVAAVAAGRRANVAASAALIASGAISDDAYYRALAVAAGVPFLADAPQLARDCDLDAALRGEEARLARMPFGPHRVLAPSGPAIAALLEAARVAPERLRGLAVTTPRRLAVAARAQFAKRIAEEGANGLVARDASLSARLKASGAQVALVFACFGVALGSRFAGGPGGSLLSVALSLMFIVAIVTRLSAALSRFEPRAAAPRPLAESELPVYTIIAALYGESRVVGQLVAAIERIDYPRAKLDVKLALEARDAATLEAVARLALPPWIEVIVAPEGKPHTKPRALNIALRSARGSHVVIYDAEDRPDPDQLRKAAAAFRAAPPDVACLQARLAIDNSGDSWITHWFAVEYATLFEVVIPGLALLRAPIPLGGTSNHFRAAALRKIGGWDAWNVTEDADLGIRLARAGLRVDALDSTTREEAPRTVAAWVAQRSRWLKGWMQTLIVHGRNPRRLARELGVFNALTILCVMGANVLGALFGPFFLAFFIHDCLSGDFLHPATPLDFAAMFGALVVFAMGPFALALPSLPSLLAAGRRHPGPWLAALPLYLLMMVWAGWRALRDLLWTPFHWAKTEHGVALRREP